MLEEKKIESEHNLKKNIDKVHIVYQ